MNPGKYKSYITNLFAYFGASLIPMLLSLLTNPLIAKNMSPEDYAVSGYYLSFTSLIQPIISFYLIHYYIKEYFNRDEKGRELLYALIAKALIWFSGIVSLLWFLAFIVYFHFCAPGFPVTPYLALMVFSLPLTGLYSLLLARYRMEKRATSFFRLSTANGVLNIGLVLLFVVWLKWGAFGKLLAPLVCNAGVFIVMLYLFRDKLKMKTPAGEYSRVFIFCLPLAAGAMLGYFTQGFSTTYLENVGNNREYGYYVVGASIAAYLTTFSTAVGSTFQPDIYESTVKKQWRRFSRLCLVQIGAYSLITLAFIALAPFIIYLLTAGRYVASSPYARIIALSTITSGIYYIVNNFSIATGRPHLYLYTSVVGSIFIVAVTPAMVDRWSYFGGAYMSVISFLVMTVVNVVLIFFQSWMKRDRLRRESKA